VNTAHTDAQRRHDPDVRSFASDNYAGVHPEVLAALALANGGCNPGRFRRGLLRT